MTKLTRVPYTVETEPISDDEDTEVKNTKKLIEHFKIENLSECQCCITTLKNLQVSDQKASVSQEIDAWVENFPNSFTQNENSIEETQTINSWFESSSGQGQNNEKVEIFPTNYLQTERTHEDAQSHEICGETTSNQHFQGMEAESAKELFENFTNRYLTPLDFLPQFECTPQKELFEGLAAENPANLYFYDSTLPHFEQMPTKAHTAFFQTVNFPLEGHSFPEVCSFQVLPENSKLQVSEIDIETARILIEDFVTDNSSENQNVSEIRIVNPISFVCFKNISNV